MHKHAQSDVTTGQTQSAGHLPQNMQESCHAEITTSVLKLEAHLHAALVRKFTENYTTEEQACQVADGSHIYPI